ncbi:hypothetical protein MMYC01_209697 [Madurella mycetomatis]|uniref:Uncharacterized protein n=1 Tax=Madurella mycetomatis TaxID=100816 RepID=A0A175VR43_9PEZI|nr:hypothetical protein MMYC01_209697 [Madurella mycetomatis]
MIEAENLRTASLYINNQLLSRGLLRDGNSIDFTHPGDSDGEVAETMSRIMAVVNDLILRRDRDAEHRESLSATLRTLRAESLRQANDIQRLQEKHAETQRRAGLSEAAEAALRTHLKTAEATVHRLKEEAARTKSLVAQTRAACANEVRKRDRQIEGLKKAVTEASRARGAGKSPGITTITVVGEVGSDADQGLPCGGAANEGYDLRMETNTFLAELAKDLSEENEALLHLIRRTTEQLKEMSGWDATNGVVMENGDGHALALAANCVDMSAEVDAVLDHLRTILTNPSFVPIEEVVVREDEIHRLRDGWEKMETRWKEAVHLIDGWRRRMQASGRPVNVEELKMGLRLSPVKVQNVEETSQGYGLRLEAVPEDIEEDDIVHTPCQEGPLDLISEANVDHAEESDDSSIYEDHLNVEDLDVEEPNVEILQQSVMLSSPPLPPPPQLSPLRDSYTAGNRGGRSNNRRREGDYAAIAEENTWDLNAEEAPLPPPPAPGKPQQSPQKKPMLSLRTVPPEEAADVPLPRSAAVSTPDTSVDSVSLVKPEDQPPPKAMATSAKSQKRPPTTRRREREEAAKKRAAEEPKPAPRSPAKSRPARPTQARGRSQTRKDEREARPAKPATRARSATSATSSRSAPAATSKGTDTTSSRSTTAASTSKNSEVMAPPPAPSPSRSPRRVNSRLPLPRNGGGNNNNVLPPPQQSPLTMATIAAKLAASEKDADAARVRAKLKAARRPGKGGVGGPSPSSTTNSNSNSSSTATTIIPTDVDAEAMDVMRSTQSEGGRGADGREDELGMSAPAAQQRPRVQVEKTRRRKRDANANAPANAAAKDGGAKCSSKTASRRRSTLNSWELDALIQGGNVVVER